MHISHLELAQLIVTICIFVVFAFVNSIKEKGVLHANYKQMVILCNFLTAYNSKFPTIESITNSKKILTKDKKSEYHVFMRNYEKYKETGNFESFEAIEASHLVEHIIGIVLSIFMSFFLFFFEIKFSYQNEHYKFRNSDVRRNYFTKVFILFVSNLLIATIGAFLIMNNHTLIGGLLLLFALWSIILNLMTSFYFITEQQKWKSFWQDALLDIMGSSSIQQNHELFNRALLLKNQIDAEPDIPFPISIAFYGVVISVVNFLLSHLFGYLNIT